MKNVIYCLLFLMVISKTNAASSDDFVIRVKTDNAGFTIAEMFRIPTKGALTYNYNVDCNNDGVDEATGVMGNFDCDYSATGLNTGAGTYTIRIKDNSGTGDGFPSINFNNTFDRLKVIELLQWGTGKWTNMQRAFYGAENMVVSATDIPDFSQVTTMESMFRRALLANPDTKSWNTSMVISMKSLFNEAEVATPDTSFWNTHLVDDMSFMFRHAYLARPDVSSWDIAQVMDMTGMFSAVTLPIVDYDRILVEFAHKTTQANVVFHGGNSQYCSQAAQNARAYLLSSGSWTIDDGLLCADTALEHDYVFTVDTTIAGVSPDTQYLIKIDPTYQYSYLVDCNNDGVIEGTVLGAGFVCDYSALGGPGVYTIRIKNHPGFHNGFSAFPFAGATINHDQAKIISLDQWGTGHWLLTNYAFIRANNMVYNAKDIPDFSGVGSMLSMFQRASLANPETKYWDTSNVTDMSNMFFLATVANPDTRLWDTSKVETMRWMFRDTDVANPDVSLWDTSKVARMDALFLSTNSANPDTSNWDTSMVTNMGGMFSNTLVANPDTSSWDVTQVTNMINMFSGVTLATVDYETILLNFSGQSVKDNVSFHGGNSKYCSTFAKLARYILVHDHNWSITDGGADATCTNLDPTISGLPTDVTVIQDLASTLNLSTITLTDLDAGLGDVTLTLLTHSANIATLTPATSTQLTISNSPTNSVTLQGSIDDINAYLSVPGNIQYTGALGNMGDNADLITLTINDGGNTGVGGGTDVDLGFFNVDIIPPVVELIFKDEFESFIFFNAIEKKFTYDFSQVSSLQLSQEPELIAKGLNVTYQVVIRVYLRQMQGQLQIRKDYIDESMQNNLWFQGQWQVVDSKQPTLVSW